MEFRAHREKQMIISLRLCLPFSLPVMAYESPVPEKEGGGTRREGKKKKKKTCAFFQVKMKQAIPQCINQCGGVLKMHGTRQEAISSFSNWAGQQKKKTPSLSLPTVSPSLSLHFCFLFLSCTVCSPLSFHQHTRASDSTSTICLLFRCTAIFPLLPSKKKTDIHYHTVTEGPAHMNKMKRLLVITRFLIHGNYTSVILVHASCFFFWRSALFFSST